MYRSAESSLLAQLLAERVQRILREADLSIQREISAARQRKLARHYSGNHGRHDRRAQDDRTPAPWTILHVEFALLLGLKPTLS